MNNGTAIHTTPQQPGSTRIAHLLQATSAILAVGLVVQAFLGGSGFFQGRPNLITIHEMVGNIAFIVAAVQVAIAVNGFQKGLISRGFVIAAIATLILVVIQLVLGFSSSSSAAALAWHLTNGVLLMGACTWACSLAFSNSRSSSV